MEPPRKGDRPRGMVISRKGLPERIGGTLPPRNGGTLEDRPKQQRQQQQGMMLYILFNAQLSRGHVCAACVID